MQSLECGTSGQFSFLNHILHNVFFRKIRGMSYFCNKKSITYISGLCNVAQGSEIYSVCLLSFVPFLEQSDLGPGKPLGCCVEDSLFSPKEPVA